jgi:hypothetical protein
MSEADLNALEREVEMTRVKFAHDLARLRSPHNLSGVQRKSLGARPRNQRRPLGGS